MKAHWLVSVVALGLGAALAGPPVAYGHDRVKVDDSTLSDRVEHRLKDDAALREDHIDVKVDDGVVTLKGRVYSESERARAARMAAGVVGVREVKNELDIDREHSRTANAAKEAWKDTKHTAKRVGESVEDAYVHTKLSAKFMDERELKGSDIDIDMRDNVAYLKGRVPSEAARERAVDIARRTDGVHRVVDDLVVDPGVLVRDHDVKERTIDVVGETGDAAITARVSGRLIDQEDFREGHINVDVVDGVVTLSGSVPSLAAHERALDIAEQTQGVRRVIDHLSVEPRR